MGDLLVLSPRGNSATLREAVIKGKGARMETVIGIIGVLAIAVLIYLFYVLLAGSDER